MTDPTADGSRSAGTESDAPTAVDPQELEASLDVIEQLGDDPDSLAALSEDLLLRLRRACGRISHPEGRQRRALSRARRRKKETERRDHDEAILERTGIRRMRESLIYHIILP